MINSLKFYYYIYHPDNKHASKQMGQYLACTRCRLLVGGIACMLDITRVVHDDCRESRRHYSIRMLLRMLDLGKVYINTRSKGPPALAFGNRGDSTSLPCGKVKKRIPSRFPQHS
ncbi:U9 [Hyposoter didymator ichnovirus]|nr:U9 [Hyposoter didymator ichnovirus]